MGSGFKNIIRISIPDSIRRVKGDILMKSITDELSQTPSEPNIKRKWASLGSSEIDCETSCPEVLIHTYLSMDVINKHNLDIRALLNRNLKKIINANTERVTYILQPTSECNEEERDQENTVTSEEPERPTKRKHSGTKNVRVKSESSEDEKRSDEESASEEKREKREEKRDKKTEEKRDKRSEEEDESEEEPQKNTPPKKPQGRLKKGAVRGRKRI
ncbi:hypothetical protein PROFUN_12059 [Planoprotostelium fungivorum]|uniref:Uncharacterized protein n=1 Tax=Planoprotostelium fungivorum TaxID=1890364 RepID=A0A2P6MXL0_9EUKA|nr:hypothetical protein PROFUN_12059 [Planoprotostelium fungivorum]